MCIGSAGRNAHARPFARRSFQRVFHIKVVAVFGGAEHQGQQQRKNQYRLDDGIASVTADFLILFPHDFSRLSHDRSQLKVDSSHVNCEL